MNNTLMGKTSQGRHSRQFPVFKQSATDWYNEERWNAIYPYLTGERFSRRFLEHFITEYSRSHPCEYLLTDAFTGDVYNFNVYHSAQTVLAGIHKRHMDVFGRKNKSAENNGRFMFGYGEKLCEVSLCELIFFRWAYQNKVMEYAHAHEEEIRNDMSKMAKIKRDSSSNSPEQKEEKIILVNPLRDEYWKDSVDECMQMPKRRRKRYREGCVDMVMNNDCEIKSTL